MNAYQFVRQMKELLAAEVWPGTSNPVFPSGSVVASSAPNEVAMRLLRPPWIMFRIGSWRGDAADPTYGEQDFEAIMGHSVPGEAMGERALLGANRQTGKSEGAGLLRIEARLKGALSRLTEDSGIVVSLAAAGAVQASQMSQNTYENVRGYRFSGWLGEQPSFPPVNQLIASGALTLSWFLPSDRYDWTAAGKVVVRRIAGSTPVTDPAAGTDVPLSGDKATTVTDTPGAGTWSYSVFALYDDDGDGTPEAYGPPETKTETI